MTSPIRIVRIPRGPNDDRGPPLGIQAPYSERFVQAIHDAKIPGFRFDKPKRLWTGYHDAIELALDALRKAGIDAPEPMRPPGPPDDVHLPIAYAELRDYQKVGVRFGVDNADTGVLIADDMGVGKTPQAVRIARTFARPTLVVHPPNARIVWGGLPERKNRKGETVAPRIKSAIEVWWPAAGAPRVLDGILDMPFRLRRTLTDGHPGILQRPKTSPPPEELAALGFLPADLEFMFTTREAEQWVKHNLEKKGITLVPEPIQLPMGEGQPLVTVIHQDILYAWAPHLLGMMRDGHPHRGTLIIDELHAFVNERRFSKEKGPTGPRRSAALMSLSRVCGRCIGLTGTPMDGLPAQMFAALDILSPGRYGDFYRYTEKYADGQLMQVTDERRAWVATGKTNTPELRHRLSWLMIRRTKGEVAQELPARTRRIVDVAVPKKAAKLPRGASTRAMRKAMELAGEGKIPEAIRLGLETSKTEKTVIYCYRRETCERIAAGLHAADPTLHVEFIHGGIAFAARAKRIAAEPRVLVTTMDVVSGAISLTFATTGIFAELHPKPNVILQCEGRQHRIGQGFPVTYHYLIAKGSLDEMLRDRILLKLDAFEETIGKIEGGLTADLKPEDDDVILSKMYRDMMGEAA